MFSLFFAFELYIFLCLWFRWCWAFYKPQHIYAVCSMWTGDCRVCYWHKELWEAGVKTSSDYCQADYPQRYAKAG